MPRPDAIVIGAGFAGLAAAVRLTAAGLRVLVVEERRRLGGRATAFPDPQTGESVDNGQHALFGCYHATFDFLREIGAGDRVRLDDRLDLEVVDAAGRRTRLTTPALPPPLHLVAGLLRWSALGLADRVAALRLGAVLRRAAADAASGRAVSGVSPDETVSAWLERHRQTPRLTTMLWEPLAVAALNQAPGFAAAPAFVEVLARLFGGDRRDAAIALPICPLDRLYAEPAREWLEARGARILAGGAAALVASGERLDHVAVRGERFEAPIVLSTVPWFSFTALAEGAPALGEIARAAAGMGSCPIVTVNLWLDRPVTGAPFVGLPGRAFQWAFDKGRLFGEGASHLSLVSSGADEIVGLTNEQLTARAVEELSAALPAMRDARVVRATAVRERRATFSLAPGQPARPGTATPVRGLYLAGDWIATGLPATIESAVVSAHRAAALAVRESAS